jgi:hypothetical protein
MINRFNTENLANIHSYHNQLSRQIDEADWIGQHEDADFLRNELKDIQGLIAQGEVYYPLF